MSYTQTLITVEEAAKILAVSPKSIYNCGAGTDTLKRVRLGRSVRLILQEVESLKLKLIQSAN